MAEPQLSFDMETRHVYSVADLVRAVSRTLETRFPEVYVEGEISSFKLHGSGHMYFCLKDAKAQVSCVMFRLEARRLKFRPEDGLKVCCRGRLAMYEPQGKFQVYVQSIEPVGRGAQLLALEQLRERLTAEGLFELTRKRPLPRRPRTIGVVTSAHGAALADIVRVLHRRAAVRVVVSPAQVQGEGSAQSLVAALNLLVEANAFVGGVDLVIIGRGGGSADDLWSFNDERVVRAVAACPIPTISAVGHEIDTTLTDFAADIRAPTPSAAAELAVAVDMELRAALELFVQRLERSSQRGLRDRRSLLENMARRLPLRYVVQDRRQLLDDLTTRLRGLHPAARLALRKSELSALIGRLEARSRTQMDRRRRLLEIAAGRLNALSPLAVLDRGYAIATRVDGIALRDASEVSESAEIEVRLSRGRLGCVVKSVHRDV